MGYRYYLCGSVRLSKAAWESAQKTTFLKLFFVDDEGNADLKDVTAGQLFGKSADLALNQYDDKAQRWNFGCMLHDDDWEEGDEAPLPKALKKLKDVPGTDLVVVAHDFEHELAKAWTVAPGKVSAIKKLPKLASATSKQLFAGEYAKALAALSAQLT
jgi:hypothetical protein